MNSKWKKTTSLLCALTVAAVPMALNVGAGTPDTNDSGVNEAVQIGEAYVEGYILTIPARFDIQNEGWNEIGDISAVGYLAEGKKLVVSADSANHWGMKNEASGKYVNYELKNSAEGEETTSWEFTELSETPAAQTIGIDVEPFKGKDLPAGEYTDVLTFTAKVEEPVKEETLLTTITATGETTYNQSKEGVVTVTPANIDYYDDTYGWLWNGTITVEPLEGYTITKCRFIQNSKTPLDDDLAPFSIVMNDSGADYPCSVITSTGKKNGGKMDGVTSIEVYGYAN